MIEPVRVELGDDAYEIVFARPCWSDILRGRRGMAITDENVARLHAAALPPDALTLPPGEEHKRLATVEQICREAARRGLDRHAVLAAFSGGVIGDLTGLAAALYMRGIAFVQVPTTLLAAVDSSVGGKTGADLPEGKNLIGAFHQPEKVLIDLDFLTTLPAAEVANGLAEVIKYGVIMDAEFFEFLERDAARLAGPDREFYGKIIRRSCVDKARIVARDERETGQRAILNYGHTIGHAIERCAGFTLPHGRAVAMGMAAAAELAVARGMCADAWRRRQNALLTAAGLPTAIPRRFAAAEIIAAMKLDKKNRDGAVTMILPEAPGVVQIVSGVEDAEIYAAWEATRARA